MWHYELKKKEKLLDQIEFVRVLEDETIFTLKYFDLFHLISMKVSL